ncbi:hypothetical protein N7476_000312 [Penicillium atrosanguineum]|uniref:Uncharacterized protein n=1 Tax=Penicillium atrosanguineum TaxID=1132637 RepID=A0A9W9UCL8_9EURO|nr:hypothetical protein N7476_000312 [Penicillium atrosanguineum]
MKSQKLPLAAEEIRKEIKTLIPQITTVEEDENGNKKFGGDALLVLISRMKAALEIDVTWEGRLRYWSKSTKLDLRKQGYLIPLSDEVQVNPGGVLPGGSFIQVNNEPVLGAGATTLFIAPR